METDTTLALTSHELTDGRQILDFMFGGEAVFTLRSKVTGTRFTYHLSKAKERRTLADLYFVKVLTGPDNMSSYRYAGVFEGGKYRSTRLSGMSADAPAVKALLWAVGKLQATGARPEHLEFYHEGRCGRCGRRLTVPESIETGIGPTCAGMAA